MKLFPAAAPPTLAPSKAAPPSVAAGIGLMVVSVAFFAAMNMLVKVIGPDYHPLEAVFFRNVIAAIFVIPFVLASGGLRTLRTRNPLGHALRAICGLASHGLCFYAFQRISLANGMTLTMSVPIFATVFAIVFLGEKVGLYRWSAVLVGFIGVIIALDPTGTIQEGSLYALAGTFFWALVTVLVKKLSATESPYTIVFYYMLTGSLVATCFLPWVWVTPSGTVWLLYLAVGVVGAIGQITMTLALKMAPASVISPFEYTQIAWAVLFDAVLWGVLPSAATMTGAAVVIATGLYIFRRESRSRS